jgi:carbon storage regulator CsrA
MSHKPERQEDRMLVLSRKQSQQITIGPDIRITIVKLERNQVRLGVEAPRDIPVLRAELLVCDEVEKRAGHVGNERPRPCQEPRAGGSSIPFE